MDYIKFLLVIIFFLAFFFLIKHYISLEDYTIDNKKNSIPIIEADYKPFKILPPPDDNNKRNPEEDSCTLNNEC